MDKNIIILILIIILGLLVYQFFFNHPQPNTVHLKLGSTDYSLEIAKTIPQQTQGLMNRTALCPNCGMIFVFGFDMVQTFWMKNTLIPLDMIFVDKNGKIDTILTAIPQPGIADSQLTLYKSHSPVRYVIELNAGDAQKLSLRPGDILSLPEL